MRGYCSIKSDCVSVYLTATYNFITQFNSRGCFSNQPDDAFDVTGLVFEISFTLMYQVEILRETCFCYFKDLDTETS